MNIETFVHQAWADHHNCSREVAQQLSEFVASTKQDQIPSIVPLITHIYGEHLGEWSGGLELLEKLSALADTAEQRQMIYRNQIALKLAGGMIEDVDDLMLSDQIRVLCLASSALLGQGQSERAAKYFCEAMGLAESELASTDPAIRSLAVTGNNLAADLEQRKNRNEQETLLMVKAAHTALKYWLKAGTWAQHQVAHYRLSKSLLAAGQNTEALEEAMSCLAMCKANKAGAYDLFWANEAVASVIHGSKPSAYLEYLQNMREHFESMTSEGLSEGGRAYCEQRLKQLEEMSI